MEIGAVWFSLGWFTSYSQIIDSNDFDNLYRFLPILGICLSVVNAFLPMNYINEQLVSDDKIKLMSDE